MTDDYARRQKRKRREGQPCLIMLIIGASILAAITTVLTVLVS